jgi:hypothetical protein
VLKAVREHFEHIGLEEVKRSTKAARKAGRLKK